MEPELNLPNLVFAHIMLEHLMTRKRMLKVVLDVNLPILTTDCFVDKNHDAQRGQFAHVKYQQVVEPGITFSAMLAAGGY